jgi:mitogen-activated protein kinase 1/3
VRPRAQSRRPAPSAPPPLRSAAIDLHTKELVAIKKVSQCFNNLTEAKRLLRELRILRHLDDPHVIKIRGLLRPVSLETFQELWIVMDYVDLDMRKLIVSPQTITLQHVQWIVRQTLAALAHIHSAHVLHRDLKPANVLLNGECAVKICDFGLSRVVNESGVFDPPEPVDPSACLSPDTAPKQITRQLTSHVVTRWYRAPVRQHAAARRACARAPRSPLIAVSPIRTHQRPPRLTRRARRAPPP